MRRVLLGLVLPAVLLAGWAITSASGAIPAASTPVAVLHAGVDLVLHDDLVGDVLISARRALLGFLLGSTTALLVGTLLARSPTGAALLTPSIRAVRTVPPVVWLPVLLLVLGTGEAATVLVVAIAAALQVVLTTAGAPAGATAPVVAGMRQGLTQSWLVLVAAELVGATTGLGTVLAAAGGAGRPDRMAVAVLLFGLLVTAADAVLGLAERLVRRLRAQPGTPRRFVA
jgi:sulfonate transport system permease protein